jgi:hypothetical protein
MAILRRSLKETNCPYCDLYHQIRQRIHPPVKQHSPTPPDKSTLRDFVSTQRQKRLNKSVYKARRNVHIDYLHGVTLSHAIAFLSIRLADPA